MSRADLISQMKTLHPNAMDYIIELLVDVHLKNPDWIKAEAKRLQREDMKGGKYRKKVAEPAPKQTIFTNVAVEDTYEAPAIVLPKIISAGDIEAAA